MITTITKDILTIDEGCIIQQVNCMGVMGSGLAKQIRDKWPIVYDEYIRFLDSGVNRPWEVLGDFLCVKVSPRVRVISVFGQYGYGEGRHTEYGALFRSFLQINKGVSHNAESPIYIPHGLGCGLGGGEWKIVSAMIRQVFDGNNVIICKLS